tara:strand:+ start:2473 stop:2835 length:363 start_codon:yes stop_codon:yes gene_type:complete
MTEILIKRISKNVNIPKYETLGSSGMDLVADIKDKVKILSVETSRIPTGVAVTIPNDFEIQIKPRSGLIAKNQVTVLNTPGTIDSNFRGEIKVILINLDTKNLYSRKWNKNCSNVFMSYK